MLDIISLRHEEWLSMARNLGGGYLSEDIIQEAYLRIDKYKDTVSGKLIDEKGDVNKFYMFSIVRNTLKTVLKKEGSYISFSEFFYEESDNDVNLEYERAYQELINDISAYVNSLGKYKSMLFNLYYKTDLSLRKISKGTGIGLSHTHLTTQEMKRNVLDLFSKQYNELKQI
tara:strand:+ start:33 stop:548 length:516 start_codon:yes stop_codon:yes gene_type:complete